MPSKHIMQLDQRPSQSDCPRSLPKEENHQSLPSACMRLPCSPIMWQTQNSTCMSYVWKPANTLCGLYPHSFGCACPSHPHCRGPFGSTRMTTALGSALVLCLATQAKAKICLGNAEETTTRPVQNWGPWSTITCLPNRDMKWHPHDGELYGVTQGAIRCRLMRQHRTADYVYMVVSQWFIGDHNG